MFDTISRRVPRIIACELARGGCLVVGRGGLGGVDDAPKGGRKDGTWTTGPCPSQASSQTGQPIGRLPSASLAWTDKHMSEKSRWGWAFPIPPLSVLYCAWYGICVFEWYAAGRAGRLGEVGGSWQRTAQVSLLVGNIRRGKKTGKVRASCRAGSSPAGRSRGVRKGRGGPLLSSSTSSRPKSKRVVR